MYIGMTVIERLPQIWNTGVNITNENKERIFRILKDLLKSIKLIVVITFTYIIYNTAKASSLPIWFTPLNLIITFGCIIYYCVKLVKTDKAYIKP